MIGEQKWTISGRDRVIAIVRQNVAGTPAGSPPFGGSSDRLVQRQDPSQKRSAPLTREFTTHIVVVVCRVRRAGCRCPPVYLEILLHSAKKISWSPLPAVADSRKL